jgi:DNA (cytosine-5)-methyltransferase 1
VKKKVDTIKFIDLFAGIGGFRIAFENLGAKCVFSSEIDKYSCQTYFANFGEIPFGDIRKISANEIPDFDIFCGGLSAQTLCFRVNRFRVQVEILEVLLMLEGIYFLK